MGLVLAGEHDPPQHLVILGLVGAEDPDDAACRELLAGQDPQQRRLAGAVGLFCRSSVSCVVTTARDAGRAGVVGAFQDYVRLMLADNAGILAVGVVLAVPGCLGCHGRPRAARGGSIEA
jgi:hypothetical protein